MPIDAAKLKEVEAFFERWSTSWEEMCASYSDLFAPDCVWENQGFPTAYGPEEALEKVVRPCNELLGMDTIKVENRHIGIADEAIWSERIDHIVLVDGSIAMSIPVVGVMEFGEDGRLRHWREYFDSKPVLEFMAQAAS